MPASEREDSSQHGNDARPAHAVPKLLQLSTWPIIVILVATMFGFGGASIYTERAASTIDTDALSIATDASPAIKELTAARSEITRIELEAASAIEHVRERTPLDRSPLDAAWSRLQDDLAHYRALPFYPEERILYAEVDTDNRSLQGQLSLFWSRLAARDPNGALALLWSGLAPASGKLDRSIGRLVAFNADQQRRLAIEIPKIREDANRVGHTLEVITALFGLSLMLLVVRAARRYSRLLDDRRRLAEEKSLAAIAYSARLESIGKATVAIAGALAGKSPLATTFKVVADEARASVNADYCALGLGSDPKRPFSPWAFAGMTPAQAAAIGRSPRPMGVLGAVQRAAHPIRLADVMKNPEFRGFPDHHPTMGPFLGIPLVHQERPAGTLYLARDAGQPAFTEDDERAGRVLAAYLGAAIDNARLYGEAQAAIVARDDLLATVSHDLKSPLNAIRLSTELLRRMVGEGKPAELAHGIDRATNRMLQLIGDLLDAAKIEGGHLHVAGRPEDVTSLVHEAVEMFRVVAAERAIELSEATPRPSISILCERELLFRVFSNLVGNALKFTPRGGAIRILVERLDGQAHFSVRDSGSGIPSDQLPHIFERYWQEAKNDRRGSGLGLYITKGIVEAHGGRIWAESKLGEGTTIHFALPIHPGTDPHEGKPSFT